MYIGGKPTCFAMNYLYFFSCAGLVAVMCLMGTRRLSTDGATRIDAFTTTPSLCGEGGATARPGVDGKYIRRLTGWGDRRYPITTKSDSAQYYFDQGLGFYFGYHFAEALASFREATRFDPSSAMTYWGQALASGPYYNTYVYKMPKEVPEVIAEMRRHSTGVNEKEKDLIDAMSRRYSTDMSNSDRHELNRNYASTLEVLTGKYPQDNDIGALHIDAVMLEHKWDFWSHDGLPRPWTSQLVRLSESILQREKHPAILHYYIHLVEASKTPQRGLASGNKLKEVNPGIGHMVHMATHMYQRNGLYSLGVSVNEEANAINNAVDRRIPSLNLGQDRSTHFFAVQSFCAMTAGMYRDGLPLYERARTRQHELSPDLQTDVYGQYVYMMPTLALVRLGKWNEILAADVTDASWKYAWVLDQFARGLAHVRKNDIPSAEKCLANIRANLDDPVLAVRLLPFNSPAQSCRIAEALLEAEIGFAHGKTDASLASFRRAIAEEDQLIYREPHDWVVPARQFMGRKLLQLGRASEAEHLYREDLVDNPGNGWSLTGLSQSLVKQGKAEEAAAVEKQAREAFASADVTITGSVF